MSVGDLIERLRSFPEDAEVNVGNDELCYCSDVMQVLLISDGDKTGVFILREKVVDL